MPQHNDTHAIPENWFPTPIEMEAKGPALRENRDEGSGCAAGVHGTLRGTQHILTRRLHLWLGCLACNAAFSLIGAGPRQFIIFNLLTLLAFTARSFQDTSLRTKENHQSHRQTIRPATHWRPLIRYLMDLLVACYAMTVFIDNLTAGSNLLGTLR